MWVHPCRDTHVGGGYPDLIPKGAPLPSLSWCSSRRQPPGTSGLGAASLESTLPESATSSDPVDGGAWGPRPLACVRREDFGFIYILAHLEKIVLKSHYLWAHFGREAFSFVGVSQKNGSLILLPSSQN